MDANGAAREIVRQARALLPALRELDNAPGPDGARRRAAVRESIGYGTFWIGIPLLDAFDQGSEEARSAALDFASAAGRQGESIARVVRGDSPEVAIGRQIAAFLRFVHRLVDSELFVGVAEAIRRSTDGREIIQEAGSTLDRSSQERFWRESHGLPGPLRPVHMKLPAIDDA